MNQLCPICHNETLELLKCSTCGYERREDD